MDGQVLLPTSGEYERPNMSRLAHVKVICPTANKMPVTLSSGFQMPSWFDLLSLDPAGKEDEAGIKKAAQLVNLIIEEELKTGVYFKSNTTGCPKKYGLSPFWSF